jgi:hypothetical protein
VEVVVVPPPLDCAETVTGMVSVVLLSRMVTCAVPALMALTLTRGLETSVVATRVLEEVALRLPEILDRVM